ENNDGRTEAELETLFRPPHPARKGREIPISSLYTRLGLNPYDRKANFVATSFEPNSVTIPLNSHIGQPAKPTVGEGDRTRRGDVIGVVDDDQLGCPVHASISGRVSAVSANNITITK
ncbi:MAG: hypothetical protein N2C14_17195, partial [Planctomycetales bacterium]